MCDAYKLTHSRIFFLVYVTIIVFAVIRVISAIFLKDTLDAAQNDAENLVLDPWLRGDPSVCTDSGSAEQEGTVRPET